MTGVPLSIDTLPHDFVPCYAYVAKYRAELGANCCTMDLAHDEGPHLNIHALEAGLDNGHDVLHVDDARGRCASVGLLARKHPIVVGSCLCFH